MKKKKKLHMFGHPKNMAGHVIYIVECRQTAASTLLQGIQAFKSCPK